MLAGTDFINGFIGGFGFGFFIGVVGAILFLRKAVNTAKQMYYEEVARLRHWREHGGN